jgi:hypothetical protein
MPQSGSYWVVEGGDNLFSIASNMGWNQRMAAIISRLNGGISGLQPGQRLILPRQEESNIVISDAEWANLSGTSTAATTPAAKPGGKSKTNYGPGQSKGVSGIDPRYREYEKDKRPGLRPASGQPIGGQQGAGNQGVFGGAYGQTGVIPSAAGVNRPGREPGVKPPAIVAPTGRGNRGDRGIRRQTTTPTTPFGGVGGRSGTTRPNQTSGTTQTPGTAPTPAAPQTTTPTTPFGGVGGRSGTTRPAAPQTPSSSSWDTSDIYLRNGVVTPLMIVETFLAAKMSFTGNSARRAYPPELLTVLTAPVSAGGYGYTYDPVSDTYIPPAGDGGGTGGGYSYNVPGPGPSPYYSGESTAAGMISIRLATG